MAVPVALVLVSHSRSLADGLAELAGQMAPDVVLVAAGGTDDGRLGTGFDTIHQALEQAVEDGRSAVVLTDLGSAVLTTESVLEVLDDDVAARVRVADAPFVEGAVEAAVVAQGGAGLDEVLEAARHAIASFGAGTGDGVGAGAGARAASGAAGGDGDVHRPEAGTGDRARAVDATGDVDGAGDGGADGGQRAARDAGRQAPAGDTGDAGTGLVAGSSQGAVAVVPEESEGRGPGAAAVTSSGDATAPAVGSGEGTARGTAVLRNRLGLHARPAAQLARTAGAFRSSIEVNGVDLRSVLSLIALGAVGGTELVVTATGPDAATAVRAVVAEIEEGFGEA